MNIPLLLISIRTESNVTEALSADLIYFVDAERHRKSHWLGGKYNVRRYMPTYTGIKGISLLFTFLSLFLFLHAIVIC